MDAITSTGLDSIVRDLFPKVNKVSALSQRFKLHRSSTKGLAELCTQKHYDIQHLTHEMSTWEDAFRIKALKEQITMFSTAISDLVNEMETWPSNSLWDHIAQRHRVEQKTLSYYQQILALDFRVKDELNAQSVALQDARLKREKENSQDIQRLREAEREEREKKRALFEAFEASQTQDRTKATQYIEGVSRGIEEADNDGQMVVDKRSINLLEDQPKVVHDLEMEIPGEEPLLRAVRERLLKAVKNRRDKPLYSLDSGEVLISTREHDGGHATILRGQRNGVAVAIKLMLIPKDHPERVYKRIYHESDIWSKLEHPRIVRFFGLVAPMDPERQLPMLVSEWMINRNAREYFHAMQKKWLGYEVDDEPDVLPVLFNVLEGLKYLHHRTPFVVHGGLTASNILIDADGSAKITDFALASFALQEQTGSRPAPLRWSSPEILVGDPATSESDIYSLASTIYEIVEDREPFGDCLNVNKITSLICKGDTPPFPNSDLSRSRGMIGSEGKFWRLLKQCWQVEPKERPTLDQISTILEQVVVDRTKQHEEDRIKSDEMARLYEEQAGGAMLVDEPKI